MIHNMKLQNDPFMMIDNGSKTIELRLYDEKRKNIKLGDTIKFLKEPDLNESFDTKVVGLLRYNSFEELINDFDISILADISTSKTELLNELEKFYPKDKQEKYGVLGIRIDIGKEFR